MDLQLKCLRGDPAVIDQLHTNSLQIWTMVPVGPWAPRIPYIGLIPIHPTRVR